MKRTSVLLLAFFMPFLILASCTTVREEVQVLEPRRVPAERKVEPEVMEPRTEPAPRPVSARRRTGRVSSETLNVRSGPNINYEVLGRLSRGDTVVILDSRFEWHEIELPPDYKGWIHSDYVRLSAQFIPGRRITGAVTGSTVNVRAMPGTGFSVLTQVKRDDRVVVIDKEGDWLGIEISRLATGWVHSEHIELTR